MGRVRRWLPGVGTGLLVGILAGGCPPFLDLAGDDDEEVLTAPAVTEFERSLRNTRPVASAGEDLAVSPGAVVVLDGTDSADEDHDGLVYFWYQTDGDPVELDGMFSALPRFRAPADAALGVGFTFRVVVSDGFSYAADEVRVTVEP